MFTRVKGKTKFMYFPSTTSQAIAKGSLVSLSSGCLIPATNSVAPELIVGVIRHAITSASDEYTTSLPVEVEVPVEKMVVWNAPVAVGTLAATSVGTYMDLTTADDGSGVDQSAGTYDVVYCTKYISASEGEFVLNIGPDARAKA
jgi:hypothetical protein